MITIEHIASCSSDSVTMIAAVKCRQARHEPTAVDMNVDLVDILQKDKTAYMQPLLIDCKGTYSPKIIGTHADSTAMTVRDTATAYAAANVPST